LQKTLIVARIKYEKLALYLILIILVLFTAGADKIPDYDSYQSIYVGDARSSDFLFDNICDVCFKLGLSYNNFRLLCISTSLIIIYSVATVFLNTKQTAAFLLMFTVYPLLIDAIQIRNFIAMSFVTLGFKVLLCSTKHCKLKYVLLVLFATCIHKISFAYLPISLFYSSIRTKRKKFFFYSIIILLLVWLFFSLRFVLSYIELVPINMLRHKLQYYFTHHRMRYGYLLIFGMHILMINIFFILQRMLKKQCSCCVLPKYINKMLTFTLYINLYMLLFFPFALIDMTAIRFFRVLIPVNYITIIATMRYLPFFKKLLLSVAVIIFILVVFYTDIYGASPEGNIVNMYFYSNWIF